MPIPLIAVAAALASGGTLVPHAAGGLIVTGAGGYVAGTLVSTTTVYSALAVAGSGIATAGAVAGTALSSTIGAVIGGAGLMGSQLGATGVTGALMAVGILPSTPVVVPIAAITAGVAGATTIGYFTFRRGALVRRVLAAVRCGNEVAFTEAEARLMTQILKTLHKKGRIPQS